MIVWYVELSRVIHVCIARQTGSNVSRTERRLAPTRRRYHLSLELSSKLHRLLLRAWYARRAVTHVVLERDASEIINVREHGRTARSGRALRPLAVAAASCYFESNKNEYAKDGGDVRARYAKLKPSLCILCDVCKTNADDKVRAQSLEKLEATLSKWISRDTSDSNSTRSISPMNSKYSLIFSENIPTLLFRLTCR